MKEKRKTSSVVLEKIEKKHLKPKPKWEYLLKNYVFWVLGAIALFIGGAATSVIIFTLVNNDWDVYRYLNGSAWKNMLIMLPYLWFIFFTLFSFVAYYNVKHTKHGYRYSFFAVVFMTLLASIILGFGFYFLGLSHVIDNSFGRHFTGHRPFLEKRQQMLVQPGKGVLSGIVRAVSNSGDFVLEDFKGNEWNILTDELEKPHKMLLMNGLSVVIIGQEENEGSFNACALRPINLKKGKEVKNSQFKGNNKRMKNDYGRLGGLRGNLQNKNEIDERRLLHMRNMGCEIGHPQK
ncbi:hypothetical protein ACFLY1_00175 [Patescibacteria group bacterium]